MITQATILLASLELWAGHPDLAHDRLHPFRDDRLDRGLRFLGSYTLPMWSTDIEALIALGRLGDAEPVLADLVDRAGRSDNPHAVAIARRCEALLLAARGDVVGALDVIEAALVAHAERLVPLELGRTLLEKGALERRAKRKSAAKRTLEEALATLGPLGARMWIDRAQDELNRIGLRRAARSDGLTPAQTRVAELLAAGMSNQEIASTLFMSTRSVESHLTKIYREFGVRSRGQLIAALSAQPSGVGSESGGEEDAAHAQTALPARDGAGSGRFVGADGLRVGPLKDG
jgi:DNA-binding CsgD family transcriptional regulator